MRQILGVVSRGRTPGFVQPPSRCTKLFGISSSYSHPGLILACCRPPLCDRHTVNEVESAGSA